MSIYQVFEKWFIEIKRLRPEENKNRKRNFNWLLTEIFLSGSAHEELMAMAYP